MATSCCSDSSAIGSRPAWTKISSWTASTRSTCRSLNPAGWTPAATLRIRCDARPTRNGAAAPVQAVGIVSPFVGMLPPFLARLGLNVPSTNTVLVGMLPQFRRPRRSGDPVLTQDEIDAFHRDGVLVIRQLLDDEHVAALQRAV